MPSGAWFRGKAAVKQRLDNIRRKAPQELKRALYTEANIEAKEVKRRTPVDKGALRSSVHVIEPIIKEDVIYVLIVAGGPAAPYALHVHEDLEAFHKVGQAKYLESVIMESRPFMAQRVARRIDLRRVV